MKVQDKPSFSSATKAVSEVSAAILCGGESKRLGRAKEFLPYAGKTLIEHCLDLLAGQFQDLVLVSNKPDEFAHLTANLLRDIVPNRGPLAAVLSALLVAENERVFVLACDLPFVDKNLIDLICNQAIRTDSLLTVYRNDCRVEALLGVYSKSCIPAFEEALMHGRELDADFLETLAPDYFEDLRIYSDGKYPAMSIDTPADYGLLLSLS